jgi:transglutaminase-like putative cysteine protease
MNVLGETVENIQHEFTNQPLRIGDLIDQCHAGVCRHRSLLFKLLADEAGLQCALVRGNYVHLHVGGSDPHAWNELRLDDGRRFLIDTTLRPKSKFPEITSPQVTPLDVAKRYVKVDNKPFYESATR